jgi:hypothetical protein
MRLEQTIPFLERKEIIHSLINRGQYNQSYWYIGSIFLPSPHRPDRPPSLLFNGYRDCIPGSKEAGPETDQVPPSIAKVNKIGIKSPLVLMAWYLIK